MMGTTQRSRGIAYSGRYPDASGSLSGCTYAACPQYSASRRMDPEWSGCRWVNSIDAARAPGPNTDSAAAWIVGSLPDQPASTSAQDNP
jgi:hypothetical protein